MSQKEESKRPSAVHPTLNRAARSGRLTEDEQLLAGPSRATRSFTETDPWRVMRIMSEFVEGFDALAELEGAVTIFGSARTKPDHVHYQAAVETARVLGEAGFAIITGGGPGIMEAGNKGADIAGAESIGLNIELPFEQHINPYVDLAIDFRYFFVRKTMLVKYAQAFVIFPGGFGTMDELFESITLIQTGKIKNFPVVLYDSDYWEGLLTWIEKRLLAEEKISPPDLELLMVADEPTAVRDMILEALGGRPERMKTEEDARAVTRQVFSPRQ